MNTNTDRIESRLAQTLGQLDGDYAFYFRDDTREIQLSNTAPDFRFRTASIIKVPILCAWALLESRGEVNADKLCDLSNEPLVEGAGFVWRLREKKLPFSDVLLHMMATSDNYCTNAVIEHLTFEQLNRVFRDDFQLTDTHLGRKMMNPADAASGRDNWTTATDMVAWFEMIDNLPAPARTFVCERMAACVDENLLLRDFADEPDGYFHKTGGLSNVMNDWGFGHGKQFFLVTNNVRDRVATRRIFGEVGKLVVE